MTKVNKNINTLNTIEIDSFKIRIPLDNCEILNYEINDYEAVVSLTTGVYKNEYINNKFYTTRTNKHTGAELYTYKWSLEKVTLQKGVANKYGIIACSSKVLHNSYFNGITQNNIKQVYDQLQSEQVLGFSYSAFLNAEIVDVDFKKDIINPQYQDGFRVLGKMTKKSNKAGQWVKSFSGAGNHGIQWGKRELASPSNPYLKLYNKTLMCRYEKHKEAPAVRMHNFYNEYLKGIPEDLDNRIRIEFTLKNKKHFIKHKIFSQKLGDVLTLNQAEKEAILKSVVHSHLLPREAPIQKPRTSLKPNDMERYNSMCFMLDNYNYDKDYIINTIAQNIFPKQRRYDSVKRLNHIWDTYIQMREGAKKAENMTNLFNALGW